MINKYKFNKNADGYIIGFYTVNENEDWVGQMANYPTACDGYTKFENGQFVIDEAKKEEIVAEKAKEKRIAELKQLLLDSDYVHNVIAEGDATEEDYAEVIANRKAWRAEIRELEN